MCRFGRLVSATRCTRSRVHQPFTCPTDCLTTPGTHALMLARHLLFVWFTSAATFSSAFFTLWTAASAVACGVFGITDRKSSGMCDAPASAVSDTAAAKGPSDAKVSRAACRGDV